jgi:hypothetical protein
MILDKFTDYLYEKENKEKDHLFFNGNELKFIEDGKVKKTWKAVSGRTHYHWHIDPTIWKKRYTLSPNEWSKAKNEGPTPPGVYTLGNTQKRKGDPRWKKDPDYIKLAMSKTTASDLPGSNIKDTDGHEFRQNTRSSDVAWGEYRWLLIPKKGTQTHGRTNFYIHGGGTPGSIGCIDLVTDSGDFADYYESWKKRTKGKTIEVFVDYSTFNKNAEMEVPSQPYKMPKIKYENDLEKWFKLTNKEISDTLNKSKIPIDPKILDNRKGSHLRKKVLMDKDYVKAWNKAKKAGNQKFGFKGKIYSTSTGRSIQ